MAKTTTTGHLPHLLARMGRSVLVVDNDHQGNLTQYFGYDPIALDQTTGTMYHVYTDARPIRDVTIGFRQWIKIASIGLFPVTQQPA